MFVIYKDINPSNIVFNRATGTVKIIDFGIATRFTRTNLSFKNPNVLEGTIAYISPEQTGRMNRMLDYRRDFYSLEVTFYELLIG
jgi:serine/threonine protein kinase